MPKPPVSVQDLGAKTLPDDDDAPAAGHAAEVYFGALGRSVVNVWAGLPRDVQQKIFEAAVEFGGTSVPSEDMARFLHELHAPTPQD